MSEELKLPETITFDDFLKVDIRAGRIETAERVPKSNKLLRLQVDFGPLGQRQILAGIGEQHDPDMLVGLFAMFVVNLAPRKMMGLESHGMILAGDNVPDLGGITVAFLSPAIATGARIG